MGICAELPCETQRDGSPGGLSTVVKRGGIGEVVQMGATKGHMKTVPDYLFRDAGNRGAIGAHGRLEIRHAQELAEARCFFWGTTPLLSSAMPAIPNWRASFNKETLLFRVWMASGA